MITKNKLWKKIRNELKELARSQHITNTVMERIRKLDNENHKSPPSENHKRRD